MSACMQCACHACARPGAGHVAPAQRGVPRLSRARLIIAASANMQARACTQRSQHAPCPLRAPALAPAATPAAATLPHPALPRGSSCCLSNHAQLEPHPPSPSCVGMCVVVVVCRHAGGSGAGIDEAVVRACERAGQDASLTEGPSLRCAALLPVHGSPPCRRGRRPASTQGEGVGRGECARVCELGGSATPLRASLQTCARSSCSHQRLLPPAHKPEEPQGDHAHQQHACAHLLEFGNLVLRQLVLRGHRAACILGGHAAAGFAGEGGYKVYLMLRPSRRWRGTHCITLLLRREGRSPLAFAGLVSKAKAPISHETWASRPPFQQTDTKATRRGTPSRAKPDEEEGRGKVHRRNEE